MSEVNLVEAIRMALARAMEEDALGYTVAHNKPYAGGFITEHYGRPQRGLHDVLRAHDVDVPDLAALRGGLKDGEAAVRQEALRALLKLSKSQSTGVRKKLAEDANAMVQETISGGTDSEKALARTLLLGLGDYDRRSGTPCYKSIPVTLRRARAGAETPT